jgi:hypothetical protein
VSHTYQYRTDWHGPYEFESQIDLSDDLEWMAREAAEHFHSERDGWECQWPREFTLLDDGGNELGRFEVERDVEPVFHATATNHPANTEKP